MAMKMRVCALVLLAAVGCLGRTAFGEFDEPGKVLFLDPFESLKTVKTTHYTQPTIGSPIAGEIVGTAKLAEGKKGRALELSGDSRVVYSDFNAINLLGGEVSFWVKLNFDPNAKTEANKSYLRNQIFFSIFGQDHSSIMIYSCLHDVTVAVRNPEQNLLLADGWQTAWKQGEWRHIRVTWGNAVEVWVDDEKRLTLPWEGLFGPLPVSKEKLTAEIGFYYSGNVQSEFTMDELTVQGPRPGNLACRPRMALPLLEGAPKLDGTLDDPLWQKAGKVTGCVQLSKRELDRDQPSFLAAYTASGVYIGAQIPLPGGRRPSATMMGHNSDVYREDSIELFFQPGPATGTFQFAANALGTKAEVRRSAAGEQIKEYDPDWQVATTSKEGEWTATAFIPYKAFGLNGPPKAGDVWTGNFIADSSSGFGNARTWAFTDADFTQPVSFGEMLFTGKARTLREESFTGFAEGNPTIRFELVGDYAPTITVKAEFLDSQGKSVRATDLKIHDSTSAMLGTQYLQAGTYTARLTAVDEAKTEFFRQNVLFKTLTTFSLQTENYPYAGVAESRANLGALKVKPRKVALQVLSSKGETVQTQDVIEFPKGVALAKFDNTQLAPGEYTVQATALDGAGKAIDTAKQALKIFPKPKWWKNEIGVDHSVPPPWTPVKATEKGFGVWGRDYQFEKGVFPQQIVNQGKPLFNAAPRLLLRAGGKETDLLAAPRQSANTDFTDQVELASALDASGVSARVKGTLEFDGCCRFDLELSPTAVKTVDGLVLELSFPREIGQFLLSSNGSSSSITELKSEFKSPFAPYIWVGNDDMGLAFFSDSDQYWNPHDNGAIQIIPSAESTLVRINVIRAPLALKKPISYSFGLMASPVRPIVDGDPFVWRVYADIYDQALDCSSYTFPEFLTYPAKGLTGPAAGTLEFWARRSKANGTDTVEVFNLLAKASDADAGFIRCNASSGLYVDVNQARLLTANVNLGSEAFSHVALTWDSKTVSLYVNGHRAATAESTDAFRKVLESAALPDGQLRFGCRYNHAGQTAVDVEEVRLSSKARYEGESCTPPAGPFQIDADTRLLDPLDETFVPDGEDALTVAGGQPSLGCRFVPGKFGKALRIEVGPPVPVEELLKSLNASYGLAWYWNLDVNKTGWPPVMFSENRPDLKERVAALHKFNLKVMPYAAFPAIGAPSELADQWGSEWEVKPVSIFPGPPPEGHVWLMCTLSARGYADYLVAGCASCMDEYGMDGVYTDGVANINSSQNLYAGAGYVDDEGNLHSTVPIWGCREEMKRMYRMVKGRKPDGLVCNHCSFNLMLPTMSFSDIYYTGEHEDYENFENVRLRFSSRPWGIQCAVLGASEHAYNSIHTLTSLVLGTSMFGQGVLDRKDDDRKWINIRKAYLAFGYKSAEWVPYFKNRDTYYTIEDPKTKISLYYHPGKDAFLIVGNTDGQARTLNLQLQLKAFGLERASLRARNALTQVPVALAQDGKLSVFVRGKSFVLVAVEPNP
jgi:hypothetical protein